MGCGASQIDPSGGTSVDEKAVLKKELDIDNNSKCEQNQNGTIPNGSSSQNGHLPQNKTKVKNTKNTALPPLPGKI